MEESQGGDIANYTKPTLHDLFENLLILSVGSTHLHLLLEKDKI
jgi:hypothetical protein